MMRPLHVALAAAMTLACTSAYALDPGPGERPSNSRDPSTNFNKLGVGAITLPNTDSLKMGGAPLTSMLLNALPSGRRAVEQGQSDDQTVGGRALSTAISGAGGITMVTPDALNSSRGTGGIKTCASTDGAYASDSLSWEPSCFGVFGTPGQTVAIYPTRGADAKPGKVVDPERAAFSPFAIQARSDASVERAQNGMAINFETVGGQYSAVAIPDKVNAVGQFISVRQRPGPNGEKAQYTWGQNIDVKVSPGAGRTQTFGQEIDLNNANRDCAPGGDCFAIGIYLNGYGAPSTAWIYSGGGSTSENTGMVTASNNIITKVSGQDFYPQTNWVQINGVVYQVQYISPTQVSARGGIADIAQAVTYRSKVGIVHKGLFFQGDNNAIDEDIALNTNAMTAISVAGSHHIALNIAGDAARFGLVASAGQGLCLDTFNSCLSYTSGGFQLFQGGAVPLRVTADRTIIAPRLNMGLYEPPASNSPCTVGDIAHGQTFIYHCVLPNTWTRVQTVAW